MAHACCSRPTTNANEPSVSLASIIQDMLIQRWSNPAQDEPGPISIFPALPSAWEDIEFHDLRTEGAFLVSAERRGGTAAWVRIKSLAGEPCRVRPEIEGGILVQGARRHAVTEVAAGTYAIDVRKGEEVVLVEKKD